MSGENKSVTLFLVLEGEGNTGDYNGKYGNGRRGFDYEKEAINCVKMWRKNGGYLKDIDIICAIPSKRYVSEKTIQTLQDMGVDCSFKYTIDYEKYPCGYWNVPFTGSILENTCKTDYIIHIDLDMYLIREIPFNYLFPFNSKVKIAINEHRPTNQCDIDIKPIYPFEINTGFIVSETKSMFYNDWWKKLKEKSEDLDINSPEYSIWEERICDIMHFENNYDFEFFHDYQINGDNNYNLKNDDTYFLHYHQDLKKKNEKHLKNYLKRLISEKLK